MRVWALVAYDGAAFAGFAANPGVTTVGGTLGDALARITGSGIAVTCAGRTDRVDVVAVLPVVDGHRVAAADP